MKTHAGVWGLAVLIAASGAAQVFSAVAVAQPAVKPRDSAERVMAALATPQVIDAVTEASLKGARDMMINLQSASALEQLRPGIVAIMQAEMVRSARPAYRHNVSRQLLEEGALRLRNSCSAEELSSLDAYLSSPAGQRFFEDMSKVRATASGTGSDVDKRARVMAILQAGKRAHPGGAFPGDRATMAKLDQAFNDSLTAFRAQPLSQAEAAAVLADVKRVRTRALQGE